MKIPDHIFRQYDIRGLVDGELTPYVTCCVGKAYGTLAREQLQRTPRVAVGRDNRPSSPALSDGLVQGLMRSGADVLDLGTVPTPTAYWAEKTLPTDGAIQITGSHNPPEWNGIKMTLGGSSVYGEAIQGLTRRVTDGAREPVSISPCWSSTYRIWLGASRFQGQSRSSWTVVTGRAPSSACASWRKLVRK